MGPLSEPTAWALVRAASAGSGADGAGTAGVGGDAAEVRVPGRPGLRLRLFPDGGWEVEPGPVARGAGELLDLFLPIALRAGIVVGQLGQSLDGRIATRTGHSHYVTGPEDIVRLHRLRALVDAVIVGAGTVAADDPRLTVRRVEGDNPVRVVMDPGGRLEPGRKVFTDGAARTLVVRAEAADAPEPPGVGVIRLPAREDGTIEPADVLGALRSRGHRRILVEGGGTTVSRFLEAGALDRLHVTVAPLIIGSGRTGVTLPPIDSLASALRPPSRLFHLGDDVLFDLELTPSGS